MIKPLVLNNSENLHIAMNLVDILFGRMHKCLERDIKINAFWRSFMLSALPRSCNDTKQYLMGMNKEEIDSLLNDMEKELAKRR